MQGLADGYFVLPYTIGQYLSDYLNTDPVSTDDPSFAEVEQDVRDRYQKFLDIGGTRSVDDFHRELGKVMIEYCGLARSREGLEKAISEIQTIRNEFWTDLKVLGDSESLNQSLERAGRVADFLELAELMCRDALDREESCGGHFRLEHQTEDGEAKRDDENYAFVSAWEWIDDRTPQTRHTEQLGFEYVALTQRSYK
jgi:succinate dehydrogenase / fumarate reductase flavoprotein subunit